MITPNEQAGGKGPIAAIAPTPAASPVSATPVMGAWARLREGSPWLKAFPMGWVPVHTLLPRPCREARGESAWDLDNRRCTNLELKFLAEVLEARGKGAATLILEGLQRGERVSIGAGHLAFVEDFTHKKRCAWREFTLSGKGAN